MHTFSPDEQEAMTALAEQAAKLSSLSDKGVGHPDFTHWKTLTQETFERYLPGTVLSSRFAQICFDKPPLASASNVHMGSDFMDGLAVARNCLDGAIEYIERFGLKKPKT
jgi:hypothetical protein